MKWLQRFWDLLKAPGPWQKAIILAAVSDGISFVTTWAPPIQIGIDIATALLLFVILGFRWQLLGPMFVEAIPGLGVFPTWTLAIGSFMAMQPDASVTPGFSSAPAPLHLLSGKIQSRSALAQIVSGLRAASRKVVFSNGVFDLLHTGHLRYLSQARALGDVLVIGLNSDASVRRLGKGEGRPILPQDERAELLAGLSCVDYVCIFDEDDPRELIKAATPSILVKGGDWPVDKILGADTVLAAGGEVKSLPFVQGRSTTSIVEKIRSHPGGGFKE